MSDSENYLLSSSFWEKGQALSFPVNFDRVLRHLRQDMRDDWYFDCLQYQDLFNNPKDAKNIIISMLQDGNGIYCGTQRVLRNIPKSGYGERYSLETDFFDRFIYQAICSFLIPYYDRLISHRVLSYRYDSKPLKEKYLFKPKIDRWFTFEGVTLTFAKSNKFLLITDVSNFFENISRDQLTAALEHAIPYISATGPEKLQIRNAITTLDKLLEKWTYSGSHGLPQNRDASSFLSNILLSSIDHAMVESGCDYYRYVDDIRILADSESSARRALQCLIRQLRCIGLNINASKTEILPPDTTHENIAKYFPSQDSSTNAINYMWQSRSRRLVTRSVSYIVEMLENCIESGETQSRQFRFAVNRIAQIVECELFDVGDALTFSLLDALSGTLLDQAVSTDQYCRLIAILDRDGRCLPALEAFLMQEEGAIHDWQNYNIWLLLAVRKYRSDALVELADRKLQKDFGSGEAAAILVWLRCVEESKLIEKSLEKFSGTLPFQNARYLLISASVLPESSLITLHGLVPLALKGTIVRAARHNNKEGLPFAMRERADLPSLVNEVSEYD